MLIKHSKYSAIIVGSGIAGLYSAIKLAEKMHPADGILVITKSTLLECNSRYAQGGIVGVLPENTLDSVSLHVSDTIKAGCGLCDFNVVKFISENSNTAIKDLIRLGVNFDKNSNNELNFTLEGAHSIRRILHAGGDATGYGIEKELINKVLNDEAISSQITVYEYTTAVDLLIDSKNNCKGLISFNSQTNEYEAVYAPVTILATGGAGQVYKYTTNPSVTTADGLALAIRANAQVKDMEFIQFHPTALSIENDESRFLISESVRGEGARLINDKGEYFMSEHPQKDLAPRDVVAREIFTQQKNGNRVFLDATGIDKNKLNERFPNIIKKCADNDIDIEKDYIPVSPAAHYCMGGIKTDMQGRTSINNLYAIGETACTSLHGANRLASNSLLECVVTAYELVNSLKEEDLYASNRIDDTVKYTIKKYASDECDDITQEYTEKLTKELKETMWEYVGIERTENSLLTALAKLQKIAIEFKGSLHCKFKSNTLAEYELRNMITASRCIINSALKRKESIGAHFRADYPKTVSVGNEDYSEDKENESKITA